MNESPVPFGMLFAESAPMPSGKQHPVPRYDPSEGMSYIVGDNGDHIPFIQLSSYISSTQTVTEVRTESTDTDQDDRQAFLATQTETKSIETTDRDDDPRIVATQTETRVRVESTDTD